MIILAYVLPILILFIWQKRPLLSFILAAFVLLIGLLAINYFEALEILKIFEVDSRPLHLNREGFAGLTIGMSFRSFIIGLPVLLVIHFVIWKFYKKADSDQVV